MLKRGPAAGCQVGPPALRAGELHAVPGRTPALSVTSTVVAFVRASTAVCTYSSLSLGPTPLIPNHPGSCLSASTRWSVYYTAGTVLKQYRTNQRMRWRAVHQFCHLHVPTTTPQNYMQQTQPPMMSSCEFCKLRCLLYFNLSLELLHHDVILSFFLHSSSNSFWNRLQRNDFIIQINTLSYKREELSDG